MKEQIVEIVTESLDDLFTKVHSNVDVKSGDFTPEMFAELEEIREKLTKLILKQITQNNKEI